MTDIEMTSESVDTYADDDLNVLLKQYYKRLFPTKLYHKWLQYGAGMCIYGCCQKLK